ncbi:MAG: tRNA (adenosine(37)-N6)-dimethylallyltransferase MiaA [Candidatus Velthaea sp.]
MTGVLLLTGPTASGKTELAVLLAERFGAEIVGADSRQIYRGMRVGTAAPPAELLTRVPHHLIGFLDPYERYSAARFVRDAAAAIADIHRRGKRVIVAGGTGFYVRALAGDVALSPAYDDALRERLAREARVHDAAFLAGWLAALNPRRAAALDPNDAYRVTRALEIALASRAGAYHDDAGRALPSLRATGIPYRKLYADVPRAELEGRIAARTERMLEAGFLEEAERIGGAAIAADAVGYPDALAYCAGRATLRELRTLLVRKTRRYAKRQATWFRTEPDVTRIAGGDTRAWLEAAREISGWA